MSRTVTLACRVASKIIITPAASKKSTNIMVLAVVLLEILILRFSKRLLSPFIVFCCSIIVLNKLVVVYPLDAKMGKKLHEKAIFPPFLTDNGAKEAISKDNFYATLCPILHNYGFLWMVVLSNSAIISIFAVIYFIV